MYYLKIEHNFNAMKLQGLNYSAIDFEESRVFFMVEYLAVETALLAQKSLLGLLLGIRSLPDDFNAFTNIVGKDQRFPMDELNKVKKPVSENKDAGESEDDNDEDNDEDNDDDDQDDDEDDDSESGDDDDDDDSDDDDDDDDMTNANGGSDDEDDDDEDDSDDDEDDDEDDEEEDEEEEQSQPPSRRKK